VNNSVAQGTPCTIKVIIYSSCRSIYSWHQVCYKNKVKGKVVSVLIQVPHHTWYGCKFRGMILLHSLKGAMW